MYVIIYVVKILNSIQIEQTCTVKHDFIFAFIIYTKKVNVFVIG